MSCMKKLTVIIPAYNSEPYLSELLDCLAPQVNDKVEVIVVDDGSCPKLKSNYEWVNFYYQSNKGVSEARNTGISKSHGEYISFIDSDDLVSDNYIKLILDEIEKTAFDYCYMSWKTFSDGGQTVVEIKTIDDKFPATNQCVWNRVYKKSFIGNVRFNPNKSIGEDAEFIKKIDESKGKKAFISEFMYFYRTNTPDSLTKRFQNGLLRTRRVIYYFPIVTEAMTFLISEFRELNKVAEIILMTNQNNIPKLSEYALVMPPRKIHGTELRGYPTNLFTRVVMPIKTDIVIWTEKTFEIGGIETFIYNFCKQMSPSYDITVLYKIIDEKQKARLKEFARVERNDLSTYIECDTLIVNRITDDSPKNVFYKQKVQMVHSCKWDEALVIPKDNDYLVPVSEAVAKSYLDFKKDYKTIHNLTAPKDVKKAIVIVSATRTGTNEKGQKRMVALSNLLRKRNIPFVWLCFCDSPIQGATNITFLKPTLDIAPYIKSADYLAQLSDHEGFCYSLVEALELGIPVLVTDLEVLPELNFKEGENGYKIPWEINDKFDVEKIFNNQLKGKFEYEFDNDKIIKQWKEILGRGNPVKKIKEKEGVKIKVRAIITFDDAITHERINKNDVIEREISRAYDLMQKKFVEMV